jgi:hypothetical protein
VDEEFDWILFAGIEGRWLDEEALHAGFARTHEEKLFQLWQIELCEQLSVEVGELMFDQHPICSCVRGAGRRSFRFVLSVDLLRFRGVERIDFARCAHRHSGSNQDLAIRSQM